MYTKKNIIIFYASIFFHFSYSIDNDVLKYTITGSAAGITEVLIDQPLVYVKNMVQQNKRIAMNPKLWWRGAGINAAGLAPVTAIQVAGNNALLKLLRHDGQYSGIKKMAAAYIAGALSGIVSSPSENIMLHQQNTGKNLYTTAQTMIKRYGVRGLYRGLTPTTQRDGIFTVGYLGVRPIIKKKLEKKTSRAVVLNLVSGISSGIIAGVITHPFDTVKTKMQAELNERESASMFKVFAKLYRNESMKGLYKGLVARTLRIASAVTIMGYVTDKLSAQFKKNNKPLK